MNSGKSNRVQLPEYLNLETLLILTICIGLIWRLINLGSREFWYDEVLSLLLVTGQKIAYQTPQDTPILLADYTSLLSLPPESSITDILTTLKNLLRGLASEPHPPLFFLSQHLWLRLFGNSEAAMRSLGVGLSCLAIFASYNLGKILSNYRQGLLFAAVLSINPFFTFQSLNLRMYGPLILWSILSAWAALELLQKIDNKTYRRQQIFWATILIISLAAGTLTFYQFAYFILALAVLPLVLKPQKIWLYFAALGSGVLLVFPWIIWGLSQQLRNADFQRFKTTEPFWITAFRHLQDVTTSLSINLILGDWETSLPPTAIIAAGIVAIILIIAAIFTLYRQRERQVLTISLILGILPLITALIVDVITNNYTLAKNSKTLIILPGCLLLISLALSQLSQRWQKPAIAAFLIISLGLSVGDFSLRKRQMFHTINDIIQQQPTTPTLIAMNARAWGHVLRLAYYITPEAPIMLLAQESSNLGPNLEKLLGYNSVVYRRLIWLDVEAPIWSAASTPSQQQQIQQTLNSKFQLTQTQTLKGTQDLDQFTLRVYQRTYP